MDMGGLVELAIMVLSGVASVVVALSLICAIVGARHGSANNSRMALAWGCGCYVGVMAAVSAAWVTLQAESVRGFLLAPPVVGAVVSYMVARGVAAGSKPRGQ